MVAGSVKRHGGFVNINSVVAQGTEVAIYLPAAALTSIPIISAMLESTSSDPAPPRRSWFEK
jgi:hypothetical protein